MAERSAWSGIFGVTVTPFTDDAARVDDEAVASLVEALLEDGIDRIVVNGHAGEYLSMTEPERRHVVEVAGRAAIGRSRLFIVGVGGTVGEALAGAEHAAANGADAVMVHHPTHPFVSPDGLLGYLDAIAAATPLPLVPYLKMPLPEDHVRHVADSEAVTAVKWGMNDLPAFAAAVAATRDLEVAWICGTSELWAPFFWGPRRRRLHVGARQRQRARLAGSARRPRVRRSRADNRRLEPARPLRAPASAGERRMERRCGEGGDGPGRPPRRTGAPAQHPGLLRRRRGNRDDPRPVADRGPRVTSGAQPTVAARLTSEHIGLPLRPVSCPCRDCRAGLDGRLRLPRCAGRCAPGPRDRIAVRTAAADRRQEQPDHRPARHRGRGARRCACRRRARHRRHQPRMGRAGHRRTSTRSGPGACHARWAGSRRCATASFTSPSASRSRPARCSAVSESALRHAPTRTGCSSPSMPAGPVATAATSTRRCSPPGHGCTSPSTSPEACCTSATSTPHRVTASC